ncbi:glycosyltransferase [Hugenholtzia roseola]|uniref:glycosyltransferase n=1 Tax=Hugenholtzia roseola TaxID=1002 RepID=UPI0003FF5C36|nr:glycosyltransferase [Hugenholtzia roseola]
MMLYSFVENAALVCAFCFVPLVVFYGIALLYASKIWSAIPTFEIAPLFMAKLEPIKKAESSENEAFSKEIPLLSILVPFRNEISNLPLLAEDLKKQTYPTSHFEVIFINDFSDDGGEIWLKEWIAAQKLEHKTNFILLDLAELEKEYRQKDPNFSIGEGKKNALTWGVKQAKGDYILTTDADCRLGQQWISHFAAYYAQNPKAQALSAAVRFAPLSGTFAHWQALEFAVLIGVGAVSLARHTLTMSNGANLSYRKAAFVAVGGYAQNAHLASGDDQFLLQSIDAYFKPENVIFFVKNKEMIVQTSPQNTWRAFFWQRKRWLSKWRSTQHKGNALIASFLFFFHLLFLANGFVFFIFFMFWIENKTAVPHFWLYFFPILAACKLFSEAIFIKKVVVFLESPISSLSFWKNVLSLQIVYSLYVLFFGLVGLLLPIEPQFVWKNRHYKQSKG